MSGRCSGAAELLPRFALLRRSLLLTPSILYTHVYTNGYMDLFSVKGSGTISMKGFVRLMLFSADQVRAMLSVLNAIEFFMSDVLLHSSLILSNIISNTVSEDNTPVSEPSFSLAYRTKTSSKSIITIPWLFGKYFFYATYFHCELLN